MEGGPGQRFPRFKPRKPETKMSKNQLEIRAGYKMWRIPCGVAAALHVGGYGAALSACRKKKDKRLTTKGLTNKGIKDKGLKK